LGIESSMRGLRKSFWIAALRLGLGVAVSTGTPGSFRGTIVDGRTRRAARTGFRGSAGNGMARRVDVSRIRYGIG